MIKNENELLGILISIQDKNGKVDNSKLSQITNTDNATLKHLMDILIEKHYVIYTYDTTDVTDLGKVNYVPKWKQMLLWLAKLLVLTVKELFVFASGVLSGLLVAYLTWKFGWL